MTPRPILSDGEVTRLASIAALLRSDVDGEALNAARMLSRHLGRHGWRPEDVVRAALAPSPAAMPVADHRRLAAALLARGGWKTHEIAFLQSMAARRSQPSRGRLEWLAGLADRAGGA